VLPEVGDAGRQKIKKSQSLVIGAEVWAVPILQYLATAGVGTIGIVDFDTIEIHNLHRQILYTEDQVGLSKAETAKTTLHKLKL
jgi:adenylyltransferase/sulfurtransferase